MDRGLLEAADIVSGDFMVREMGRRCRNFMIIRKKAPGYFTKQITNAQRTDVVATLRREAAFYQLLDSRPQLEPTFPR